MVQSRIDIRHIIVRREEAATTAETAVPVSGKVELRVKLVRSGDRLRNAARTAVPQAAFTRARSRLHGAKRQTVVLGAASEFCCARLPRRYTRTPCFQALSRTLWRADRVYRGERHGRGKIHGRRNQRRRHRATWSLGRRSISTARWACRPICADAAWNGTQRGHSSLKAGDAKGLRVSGSGSAYR